jgi:hypothetical protein
MARGGGCAHAPHTKSRIFFSKDRVHVLVRANINKLYYITYLACNESIDFVVT